MLIRFNVGEPTFFYGPLTSGTMQRGGKLAFKFRLLSVTGKVDGPATVLSGHLSLSSCQKRAARQLQNCLKPVIVRSERQATIRRFVQRIEWSSVYVG